MRLQLGSLALGAMAIWMMNATFFRPGHTRNELYLAERACQQVVEDPEVDDPNATRVPILDGGGSYFLCDVIQDTKTDGYRLPMQVAQRLEDETLFHIYRAGDLDTLRLRFGILAQSKKGSRANPERTRNRTVHPTTNVDLVRSEDRPRPQFPVHLNDITRHPRHIPQGRDVDELTRTNPTPRQDEHEGEGSGHHQRPVGETVSLIWEQFFLDLIAECPNMRDRMKPSWCNIPQAIRIQESTEELFRVPQLPLNAAQVTFCSTKQWEQHFKNLFPMPGEIQTTGQNYARVSYRRRWIQLIGNDGLSEVNRKQVAASVRKKFDQLAWLPYTAKDKIWATHTAKSAQWWTLPSRHEGAAPLIGINPLRVGRSDQN